MAKSGIRVFSKRGIKAKGLLLPIGEFKLYRDLDSYKIHPERARYILEKAEVYLNEDLMVLPLSLYRDKFVTGSRSNYENVHHHRRDMLYYMTLAEMYENKGRFTEKIADVLWAIMEETTWVIPAHQGNSLMYPESEVPEIYRESDSAGLDLYAANCSALVAFVKYFMKDKLDAISPIICKRIDHLVYLRCIRPFIVGTYWWMSQAHNWVTGITMNVLTAAAITVSDMEVRQRVVNKAMQMLDNFTAGMPEDGCCDEGAGYWAGGAGGLFQALLILDDMSGGKINVYDEPIVRNLCEFVVKVNIHGNEYVPFADCHNRISQHGEMIMHMGEKLNSSMLYAFGKACAIGSADRYYFFGFTYGNARYAMSEYITDAGKTNAELASWLAGHKVAVLRESEDTSRGFFLGTKGGTNSEPGNHNDVGSLVIYKDAVPLIVDPGIGSYNNDYFGFARYYRWFTQAQYHSCPTFNGIDQVNGGIYSSKNEVFSAERREVSMELTDAYKKEAGLQKFVRTCHVEYGRATVTDEVEFKECGEVNFHFTAVPEPKLKENGVIELGHALMRYNAEEFTPEFERVVNKCLPYDDLNINYWWGVDCLWRIIFKKKTKACTLKVTFE